MYPEQVKAVWSSSGVIDAIVNFTDFDLDVYETTMQSGTSCTEAIISVYKKVDELYTKGPSSELHKMFDIFHNKNYNMGQGAFDFFIADTFATGVQYGYRKELCEMLMQKGFTDNTTEMFIKVSEYAEKKGVDSKDYERDTLANTTIDYYLATR